MKKIRYIYSEEMPGSSWIAFLIIVYYVFNSFKFYMCIQYILIGLILKEDQLFW